MWVGTRSGRLWRWTSNKWALNSYSSGGDPVISLWGATATDLWAVNNSNVGHLSGTTWQYNSTLLFRTLYGRASNNVWAIDYLGLPWQWNGTVWKEAPIPSGPQLLNVTVAPDGTVWAVGTGGALLRKTP